MKCSVVILNWNGATMLRRYLPSVLTYTQNADYEVVVADNGSTDDSLQVLDEFAQQAATSGTTFRTLRLDRNYGFAEGYNRALAEIDSDYCVLLNSDVEVTAGWLDSLLAYLDSHPEVAACQPKVLSWLSKEESLKTGAPVRFEHAGAAGGYLDKLCYPFCRGRILEQVEEDKGQYDTIVPIFWATGACLCVRTYIYKECGGLDARFFAHQEEIDLCWRMQCRGYHLVCIPQSVIYHLGGGALAYESPRKTYLNFRNCLLMAYKNLPANRLHRVMAWRFVLDYAAAAHLLVCGKPKNAWAVVQARWDYQHMKRETYFVQARAENLKKAIVPYPETIAQCSILFAHYFKHKNQL